MSVQGASETNSKGTNKPQIEVELLNQDDIHEVVDSSDIIDRLEDQETSQPEQ